MTETILPMESLQAYQMTGDNYTLLSTQHALEELFFKNNIMNALKTDFSNTFDILFIIENKELDKDFAIMFLVHTYLRKQTSVSVLAGCLLPYAKNDLNLCATLIEACVDADLADWDPNREKVIMIFEPEEEVKHQIELNQYHLPLIMTPLPLKTNMDTGYYAIPPNFVVTNRAPDNDDYCLEVLNILNATPIHINPKIALGIENTWKNCIHKPGESIEQFKLKQKALLRYNTHAGSILNHYVGNDYKVFFSNFYDSRGRIYPRGYYINPQGNAWNKAGLDLAPALISSTTKSGDPRSPLDYLKADIATNYGIKGNWEHRIDWTNTNDANLNTLIEKADDPALFFASIEAYDLVKRGEPTGYAPTLDATASGLQWLSVLSGCPKSAYHCNVLPSNDFQDAYTNVYSILKKDYKTLPNLTRKKVKNAVMTSLYGSIKEPTDIFIHPEYVENFFECMEDTLPGAWALNQDILGLWNPRALEHSWTMPDNFRVNIPVMDKIDYVVDAFDTAHTVRIKKNMPVYSSRSLGPNLVHSIDSYALREMLRRCSGNYRKIIGAKLTSGSTYKDARNIKMVGLLLEHHRQSGILSSRILHYIDNYTIGMIDKTMFKNLYNSLPDESFRMMTIHDAFRACPNNLAELQRQYNQILFEVANSSLMEFIVNQFHTSKVKMTKGTLDSKLILQSQYALS